MRSVTHYATGDENLSVTVEDSEGHKLVGLVYQGCDEEPFPIADGAGWRDELEDLVRVLQAVLEAES